MRIKLLCGAALLLVPVVGLVVGGTAGAQKAPPPRDVGPSKVRPKLEPVAETKLLMEGLAYPNFRGLDKLLKQRPEGPEPWKFARGQALLIAETANLLMLRPPRSAQAQPVWFARAADLRDAARNVARSAGLQDYERSRANFVNLANACNRCHQTFRVPAEVVPFEEPPAK